VLAEAIRNWASGNEDEPRDAEVASFVLAEVALMIRRALTK